MKENTAAKSTTTKSVTTEDIMMKSAIKQNDINNPAIHEAAANFTNHVVSLRDLSIGWSASTPIVNISALDIVPGEHLFLYGPSGSGKSSLLNVLTGVLAPLSGRVQVLGQDLTSMGARARDKFRARHIGVIFQEFNLIPYLSVLDNALLGAHFAGLEKNASRARVEKYLLDLGISRELFSRSARCLSVGQQQRVAVARALAIQPKILIADEPTSALDSDTRDLFMQLLFKTARGAPEKDPLGCTIIFVSHDKSLASGFSRVIDIRDLNNIPGGAVCC